MKKRILLTLAAVLGSWALFGSPAGEAQLLKKVPSSSNLVAVLACQKLLTAPSVKKQLAQESEVRLFQKKSGVTTADIDSAVLWSRESDGLYALLIKMSKPVNLTKVAQGFTAMSSRTQSYSAELIKIAGFPGISIEAAITPEGMQSLLAAAALGLPRPGKFRWSGALLPGNILVFGENPATVSAAIKVMSRAKGVKIPSHLKGMFRAVIRSSTPLFPGLTGKYEMEMNVNPGDSFCGKIQAEADSEEEAAQLVQQMTFMANMTIAAFFGENPQLGGEVARTWQLTASGKQLLLSVRIPENLPERMAEYSKEKAERILKEQKNQNHRNTQRK